MGDESDKEIVVSTPQEVDAFVELIASARKKFDDLEVQLRQQMSETDDRLNQVIESLDNFEEKLR